MGSNTPDISAEGENFAPDVEVLQTFLINHGYKSSDTTDGLVGDITVAAIKAFQQNGLKTSDGIAGTLTKQQITAPMFDRLPHISKPNDLGVSARRAKLCAGALSLTMYLRLFLSQ